MYLIQRRDAIFFDLLSTFVRKGRFLCCIGDPVLYSFFYAWKIAKHCPESTMDTDFTTNAKKRKAEGGANGGAPASSNASSSSGPQASGGVNKKAAENLDFRVRVIEAITSDTFKVPKSAWNLELWTRVLAAKDCWRAEKPTGKSQAHPWGPERHTLMCAVLQCLVGKSYTDIIAMLRPVEEGGDSP